MFNNVVMNKCSTKAVCAWEVDHIFPWARGGCSVQTNFAGVQWGANNKKRDKKFTLEMRTIGLRPRK